MRPPPRPSTATCVPTATVDRSAADDAARSLSVALAFVERVNAADVDGLAALMTEDHEFIDMPGESHCGREQMRQGWAGYYAMFPNYHIDVERSEVRGNVVVLVGSSSGTLTAHGRRMLTRPDGSAPAPEELQGPAIWTAEVRGGQIAVWRVWADTPDVRKQLEV